MYFFHWNGLITVNEILQFEAVNVIYLYKIHITWISSYFCLQRFSSIFESTVRFAERLFVCLFDLILYVPSTIFQLNRDGSSWVEPVLSYDKCVRLEPAAPRSRVKHCTIEPLHSLSCRMYVKHASLPIIDQKFPVLNSTCSLHVGYTGIMRDINIVELSPHRECPMRFFF